MKKIFLILLTAIMMLSAVACQATPDEVIVVQKDTDRLVEQVQNDQSGEKLETFEVPVEKYVCSTTGAEGKLTINADAKIIVPNGKLPTARVSAAGFDQDTVTGLFNFLFPDEKPVSLLEGQSIWTKSDIENEILSIKKQIAEGSLEENTVMTEDEALEYIESLEEQMKTAPETAPESELKESDGTMKSEKWQMGDGSLAEKADIYLLSANSSNAHITVSTPVSTQSTPEAYFAYSKSSEKAPDFNTCVTVAAVSSNEDLPAKATGKLNMTYDTAKQLCDDFFKAGNVTDIQLSKAYVIGDSDQSSEDTQYAYSFYYVRTVNGTPAIYIEGGNGDDTSLPWGYETAQIIVNDDGIINIRWDSPTSTGEIIAEDTGLMPFEKIADIFESMILVEYEPRVLIGDEGHVKEVSMEINIDEVELGLIRIRTQNSDGREGLYTPAWVFYGNTKTTATNKDGSTYTLYNDKSDKPTNKPIPLLVINAVDGSIIDLEKGY